MLVCAQVSSFTKEMDFYITPDYLNSVILKTRSLLWELRGSRSGMAGDSVLFTHNPGWMSNRNSTSRQCSIIFLPNVRIRLPNHVAVSFLSSCVTRCSDFLCLFILLPIHSRTCLFSYNIFIIKIQDCQSPLIHSSHVNSKGAAPSVHPKSSSGDSQLSTGQKLYYTLLKMYCNLHMATFFKWVVITLYPQSMRSFLTYATTAVASRDAKVTSNVKLQRAFR